MENICLEELHFINEEIRKENGKPFDPKVNILFGRSENIVMQNVDYDLTRYLAFLLFFFSSYLSVWHEV